MEIIEICRKLKNEVNTNLEYYKATKNSVYQVSGNNLNKILEEIMRDEKLAICECCGDIVPEETLIDTDDFIADGGIGIIFEKCYRGLK
jgi:biotin synthase-like enzyme